MESDERKKRIGEAVNRAFSQERRGRSSARNLLLIVGVLVVAFALRETGLIGDTHEINTTVTGDMAAMVEDLPQVNRLGNAEAETVLFVFSDYLCSHCRRLAPALDDFLEANPHTRVAVIDLPGEAGQSLSASRHALAAGLQGAWPPYYRALMYAAVPVDDAGLAGLGEALGLDSGRLTADAESQTIADALAANRELASRLGIEDVPTIVIGDQMIVGFVDASSLKDLVAMYAQR